MNRRNIFSLSATTALGLAMFTGLTLTAVVMINHDAAAHVTVFKAKQVRLIVGFGAGGVYDQYGKLVARYIGKYLPGNPNVIVQNMPAAGSIAAANTIYALSPKDGSVFGIIARDVVTEQLIESDSAAKFDPMKLTWIGSATPVTGVCIAINTSPVKSFGDLFRTQMTVGGTGAGAGNELNPKALNALLGTQFSVIGGYKSAGEIFLAMDRNEVDGFCSAYAPYQFGEAEAISSGKLRVLFQAGLKPSPLIKAPLLLDLVQDEDKQNSLKFIYGADGIGFPFVAPPDLPPEIVTAFRSAFDAAVDDPEFRQEAEKQRLEIDPTNGATLEHIVRAIISTPAATVNKIREIYDAR